MTERTALIQSWTDQHGAATLTEICLALRSSCRGDSDPWCDDRLDETVKYLSERIRLWQEPTDAIDRRIRSMCQQAVWIGRAEISERAAHTQRRASE